MKRLLNWLFGPAPQFDVWALPKTPWADWLRYRVASREYAERLVSEFRRQGWGAYYERVWWR